MDGVNIQKILKQSIFENKTILFSIIPLVLGYWANDVEFTKQLGNFTANLPNIIHDLKFSHFSILIILYIASHILYYIDDRIIAHTLPNIQLGSTKEIIRQVMESVKTTQATFNTNELMMNLKKIFDVKELYYMIIWYIIPTLIIAGSIFYIILKHNTKAGMFILVLFILAVILIKYLTCDGICVAQENEDTLNAFYDEIHDIVSNIDNVIISNTEKKEMLNISAKKKASYDKFKQSEITNANILYKLNMVSLILIIIINGTAIKTGLPQNILITICLLSIKLTEYVNASAGKFKNSVHIIGKYYESQNYFNTFKIKKETAQQTLKVTQGTIEFKNIKKTYKDRVILDGFNLKIKGGQKIGIMGKIGTGKTTLLKMLVGLTSYDGNVYIDGGNLKQYTYESINNNIVYISQQPKLFNRTIYDNLNYGSNYTQEQILARLDKLKLKSFIDAFPNGLNTDVGKEGANLSGGQKQMVLLIRTFLQNKPIILLDEPTSAFDEKHKSIFIDLMKNMKNKTIIIVTHDKQLTPIFDVVVNLS